MLVQPLAELVARKATSHKHSVPDLFDMRLRQMRRDRAARSGPALFLLERALDDCLERIQLFERGFRRGLLVGCPDSGWPARIPADSVTVLDPGPIFASRAGGDMVVEDQWQAEKAFDLVVAIGTLDTVNDLLLALRGVCAAMQPDSLFIGAMSGGDTLPRLRAAMRAADAESGVAAPHVHPRIEPSALGPLLEHAGLTKPVIDVDRVQVSYRSLGALVADLRRMGATNILTSRPRSPMPPRSVRAASEYFAPPGGISVVVETFDIIHFAAWSPPKMVKRG